MYLVLKSLCPIAFRVLFLFEGDKTGWLFARLTAALRWTNKLSHSDRITCQLPDCLS